MSNDTIITIAVLLGTLAFGAVTGAGLAILSIRATRTPASKDHADTTYRISNPPSSADVKAAAAAMDLRSDEWWARR